MEGATRGLSSFFPVGQVAQLVERSPEKAGVGGSIPSLATISKSLKNNSFQRYLVFLLNLAGSKITRFQSPVLNLRLPTPASPEFLLTPSPPLPASPHVCSGRGTSALSGPR